MKIRHKDIVIDQQSPFANCKLDREQYATVLTDIVQSYADGFVMAINNEWGTGKTTFVKMWQQHLINQGFQTLYFNAWENDFDNNPLAAIMAELKSLNKSEKTFKTLLEKGATLTKHLLPTITKGLLKNAGIDSDAVIDAVKSATEGATEILEEEIKEYTDKKKGVKDFQNALAKYVVEIKSKESENKPLVFIIDELDRCRPSYAVEVLERIKHLFSSVEGIVFVLAIDKEQLAHAIRGVYGSDLINTDEYLRRFIDLEYSIPRPSVKDFCKYLYDYYAFKDFFNSAERNQYPKFRDEEKTFIKVAEILFEKDNATLRQMEKLFSYTRLVVRTFKYNQYVFPYLLFLLLYLKTMKLDSYEKILFQSFSLQELSNLFSELFDNKLIKDYEINILYIQALLIRLYFNGFDSMRKLREPFVKQENGERKPTITSTFDESGGEALLDLINRVVGIESDFGLLFILSHIDLSNRLIEK